ncbi:MAG: hypothetical protein H9535_17665 [Ignavibacteria bacterium]|nr:hypothetical protein [Ignavibacteria bacterium]
MRGFNLPAKGIVFNHPFVRHIGIGTQIEHEAPATLGTMIKPLGNDQDEFFDPSAV